MQKQIFDYGLPIDKVIHMGKSADVKFGGSIYQVKSQRLLVQRFQIGKVTFGLGLDVASLSSRETDTSNSLSMKDTD